MSNHAENSEDSIWRFAHKLEKDIGDLAEKLNAPSIWTKIWDERNWLIPAVLVVLGAIGTFTWYVGGLILDSHIQSSLKPTQDTLIQINGDIRELKGRLNDIQLKQLSNNPADRQVTKEVRSILTGAKSGGIQT